MMKRFCRYVEKVFDLGRKIDLLKDSRRKPRIPLKAIWGSVFFLFVLRQRSLNGMEGHLRQPRRMERLIGQKKPSADRLGQVMSLVDPDPLRALLSEINHRLGRNKRLKNEWPLRIGVLDGHEFFSSRQRCCPQCLQRRLVVKGEEVVEYFHRGVAFYLVGFRMPVPLDVEMLRPGEGELTAAQRLLPRVVKSYGRLFAVVLGDGLYFNAPFFHLCLGLGKDVITVLKDEGRVLFQDAQGVFSLTAPQTWEEGKQKIQAWDAEGFTSAEGIEVPLRVLRTEEVITRRHRQGKGWVEEKETHHWEWVTTLPATRLSTRLLWQIGHARWEVENDLFHTLVTYWSLDHCFRHEPTAILNFTLTLFIAFVLLQSFYLGNLKPQRRAHLTFIAIAQELLFALAIMDGPAPWLRRGG